MTSLAEQIAYNDRKLAHYNEWLMDPKRPFGVPYAGFPEDKERRAAKRVAKVTDKVEKVAKKGKPVAKITGKRSGVTKLDQAKALFQANPKLSRVNMIALFQEQLQMSLAGATTYYYNAQK